MAEHISYIDDDEEMARRRIPPPPATFLAPPAFLETVADKSLQQLRDFAAKIQELNLKNVCKYEPTETILNPEEIFEPRESPKPLAAIPEARTPEFPPSQAPIAEVLESALVADLTQSETPL